MTEFSGLVQRVCKCGCNEVFRPPASRPGTAYKFGHKPRSGPALGKLAGPTKTERRTLDFKMALKTANEEMAGLVHDIDALDDKIVPLQKQVAALIAEKEKLCGRHYTLTAAAETLKATIDGLDLRNELQEGA